MIIWSATTPQPAAKGVSQLHTFRGNEIVASTRRLCLMNMFLHNIGQIDGESMVAPTDALIADTGERFDYVLANPPFGKKSSITATNEAGEEEREDFIYNRQDFWATTSNKQLNFVQHIRTMLKSTGRAAVVVPDNVLFEGGAGETVRKSLLQTTDLHTILRLPTGVFYKQGVKANVIFFDNKPASKDPWTQAVWIYDFRTNIHFTSRKTLCSTKTCKTSLPATGPTIGSSGRKPGRPTTPKAAGAASATPTSSPATKPTSTSSGLKTNPDRPGQPARSRCTGRLDHRKHRVGAGGLQRFNGNY